jgi:signal transduction histidine kinase/DNA-binding response OmpR family regulator
MNTTAPIFAGTSDMARLMRDFRWDRTPLGSPDAWPRSLQTVVRVMLTSRYAMWMGWGPELTFFYNDAYAAMTLGAKHPWALGRPSRDVWAEIWSQIGPRIDRVLKTGEATWDEALLLFLERNGYPEETYHTFSYSPLADDEGRIQGHLCVVTEETTRVIGERRLGVLHDVASSLAGTTAERELQRSLEAALGRHGHDLPFTLTYLLDADARIARLWASSGIAPGHAAAPAVIDAGDSSALWPVFEAARTGEPVVATLPPHIDHVPHGPWDRPATEALLLPIARQAQGQPAGVFVAGLNPFRQLDEACRSFLGLLVGQIAAGLATARAYDEERRRAESLAELDRAKTTFFSNVSHEFRTPLTLILGPLEDALGRPGARLEGAALESSYRNALRLLKLVNALLDFARIEAGRVQAKYAPTDLASLTSDLASVFRAAIESAGLGFAVDAPDLPEPVWVDRDMWETIVLNLLSNALKFTFAGEIRVRVRDEPGTAVLTVTDTGVGVPPEELPHLFERFHRVEETRARTHEGSGIGLALVSELVRLHGGTINAQSVQGSGTTFTVRIPLGSGHLPKEQLAVESGALPSASRARAFVEEALRWGSPPSGLAEPPEALAGSSHPRAGRVVLADDNADMRQYVTELLAPLCDVEAVADGEQALAALRREPADVLLTDVMMPVLDGLGLLRTIRSDPALRDLSVVMLSARSGEDARIEGLEAGADDYLFKPFSARELVARVTSQIALARARREAATERDRFRSLLMEIPAVVNFLRGEALVFEFAHPLAVRAVGGRPLAGRPVLEVMPEHEGQPFIEQLRHVYRTGEPVSGREALMRIARRPDGELEDTYWNYTYLPVRSASGEVEGVMTFDVDVTEQVLARKRLEEQAAELSHARHEAESATRAKDEFLAVLGHELRNPLAPILTALELLRLRGDRSREHEVIRRQVGHLTRLVDDLLDVARITRGKVDLTPRPIEIADVIVRALESVSPLLDERKHAVDVDVPHHGLTVLADGDRLAQIFVNLLTNAAKYSNPGSRIRVAARRDALHVEVSVRDEGVGISADMLGTIFDAFVQQPQTIERALGGLGLGLTIVKTLVEAHGGTIRARSEGPGRGSEFVIRLPAVEADGIISVDGGGLPAVTVPRRGRILVVDDSEDGAAMLQAALELLGYEADVAHDGVAALDLFVREQPDVALLDIGLPVMDGYELAARLRALARGDRRLLLVAITGYGQARDRARAIDAGFDRHLVKPIEFDRLEQMLDEFMPARHS